MVSMLESVFESWLEAGFEYLGRSRSRIPGPGIPLLGDLPTAAKWMLEHKDKLPMHRTLELHEQYGSVYSFNVGPATFVIVGEQQLLRRVLTGDEFQQHVNLPFLRRFGASRGLFMVDGRRWRLHRRFSHRTLRDLGFGKTSVQESIEEEAGQLVSEILRSGATPQAPQPTVAKAVSNVINRLVFGRRFGYEDPEFESYLRHTRLVTNISLTLVFLPLMLPWLEAVPQLMRRLPGSNTFAQGYAFIKEFCMNEIRQHKRQQQRQQKQQTDCNNNNEEKEEQQQQQQQQQQLDFIHLFLQEQRRLLDEGSEEAKFFEDEDLCDIVADFFVAGTDTTTVALTWSLLLAATHQEAQDKLRAELFPLRSAPSLWQRQQQLHYSRAFIEETLRYCVLTPINFRHSGAEAQIGEFSVPAGCVVGANAFAVSRDPSLFPQPHSFRPERFLDDAGCYRRNPAMDGISFGAGKRGCMGESLARNELLVFLGRVVQSFQIELPADERHRLQEILLGEDGAVHQPKPHRLLFTPLQRQRPQS